MPIFVVHEHHATHLHYDLRLELDGMLKSWAVPKEPPMRAEKRLAIQVDDHELSYADFEGTIPEGMYGAGKVKIWDKGTFKLIERAANKIVFELSGKKLHGVYCLVKFHAKEGKGNEWLLFRK